jgi:SWI/SNF-related matrix-associated actin-dependent regulator 1 of chromatin subfamily A
VIVDEGHWVKNGRAARSTGTMMVAGTAPYCLIATATPMTNRPSELWHLLSILTNPYAFGSPVNFRVRYAGAEFNGHGYQDTQPTHTDELRIRIKDLYVRKTAKDVALELPPLTRVFHEIDPDAPLSKHDAMTTEQMALLVAAIKDGGVSQVLALLTDLRKETSARKFSHTVEYAANAIEQGEKVVIFTWQRATAQKLAKALSKNAKVHCITGEDDLDVRERAVAAFQAGDGDVIVATLSALKEGVTLHAARIVIIHDLDWVPASLRQAERRILRIGQERPCISVWMMCRKSVDMIFAAMLLRKLGSISETLGEAVEGFEGLAAIAERERSDLYDKQIQDWLTW